MSTLPFAVLARNLKTRNYETIQYPGNGVIFGVAAPTRIKIPRNFVLQDLNIYVSGTCTVAAGAADGALQAEQPLQLIREIRIEGTSQARPIVGNIKRADCAALYRYTQFNKGTAGQVAALAIPGIQAATPFAFDLEIDFELARCIDPRLTLLNSRELDSLDLIIDWETTNGLIFGGDRNVTINGCNAVIVGREFQDRQSTEQSYGVHNFIYMERAAAAADARFLFEMKRGHLLRGFLIKQFTQAAVTYHTPVATIINSMQVELNGDIKIIYPSWAQLTGENKNTYGLEAMPLGYAFLDLMTEGKPDTMVDTRNFESIDLVFNVNAIANGRIRVYPVEIIPVPGR